jgi:hypothetical protein
MAAVKVWHSIPGPLLCNLSILFDATSLTIYPVTQNLLIRLQVLVFPTGWQYS